MPSTPQAAIAEWWASAGLDSTVGPLYFGRAKRAAVEPYVVGKVRRRLAQKFADGQLDDMRVRLRIRSTSEADAQARGDLIDAPGAMPDRTFAWGGSVTSKAVNTDRNADAERQTATNGDPLFYDELEYQFWVSR
jgi:hypothetical protein